MKNALKTRSLLQFGNRKLPKTTGIFNLPRIKTCPGRTSYCMSHCYAKKAETMYKQVPPYREAMLAYTEISDFVRLMIAEIKASKGLTAVRIHESGDFYDQEYLEKWFDIAKALPAVAFYAYTKSFMLDFSQRPKNLVIRGSIDPSSKQLELSAAAKLDGTAETWDPSQKNHIVNPSQECPGSCKSCTYCLRAGDVWFHLH